MFVPPTDQLAAQAESVCYDVLGQTLGGAMGAYVQKNGKLDGYPRTQTNFMTNIKVVKQFLEQDSQPLLKKLSTPIFIYQGSNDTTVPKAATDVLIQLATSKGTKINYVTDTDNAITPKWDHATVYTANWDEIILDVKSLMPIQ